MHVVYQSEYYFYLNLELLNLQWFCVALYSQDCLLGWGNCGMAFHSLLPPWWSFVGLFTWSVYWLDMTPFLKYASCPLQLYHGSKVHPCWLDVPLLKSLCNVYFLNFMYYRLNYPRYKSSTHLKAQPKTIFIQLLCWMSLMV